MEMVVCVVPVSPMRKEDSHRVEMVSELLFGEVAEVLERTRQFTKLRGLHDNYEGWCQSGQLAVVDHQGNTWHKRLAPDWITPVEVNGQRMNLSLGSSLDMFNEGKAQVGPFSMQYSGDSWDPSLRKFDPHALCEFAKQYLNTPYLWGGRSVFGIDCSGFAQQCFRFFDRQLPRDSSQQVELGEPVGFLQEAKPGDLAFFDNEEGRIVHVGILLGPETIIHSSGKVRIDKIDAQGIVNGDTGERTHKLRVIKRVS
ncbi:MAG: C40 family peptidase [Chitinophagaceae bacterium]|nr:C40 family peptidase [Chitinophagaceae bacterium]